MGQTVDVEQPRQAHFYAPNTNINNPPPQTVPVYVVGGVSPTQEPLACGGLGLGWTFFIIGFFFPIFWYVGAFMLFCATKDEPREKPGFTACLIAAILFTVLITVWIIASAA